jgi:hypothetical protein
MKVHYNKRSNLGVKVMEVNTTFNNFKLPIVSLKNPNVSLRDRNFVKMEQPALIRPVDVIIKTDMP